MGPSKRGGVVSAEDEREMSRILDYLIETHGKEALSRWPGPSGLVQNASDFLSVRNLEYVERYGNHPDTVTFYGDQRKPLDIRGYAWLVPFQLYAGSSSAADLAPFALAMADDDLSISISEGGTARASISLMPVIERARAEHPRGKSMTDPMSVSTESGGWRLQLLITHLHAERRGQSWAVQNCGGTLLIAK